MTSSLRPILRALASKTALLSTRDMATLRLPATQCGVSKENIKIDELKQPWFPSEATPASLSSSCRMKSSWKLKFKSNSTCCRKFQSSEKNPNAMCPCPNCHSFQKQLSVLEPHQRHCTDVLSWPSCHGLHYSANMTTWHCWHSNPKNCIQSFPKNNKTWFCHANSNLLSFLRHWSDCSGPNQVPSASIDC